MELGPTAQNIELIITEIRKFRLQIKEKGEARAKAMKAYDRDLAIALATLGNAENYELAGKTYKVPPVSVREKIAKGMVAEQKEKMELADSDYRATLSNLEALKAQMNAMQSIYRHME
jgi:hypothetical protein